MKKTLLLSLLLFVTCKFFGQTYTGDNGITLNGNAFQLGGTLNKSTLIDGNLKALRFTNVDTFYLGGRYIQLLNSTKKTFITSFDSLNLLSSGEMLLSAQKTITLDGKMRLLGYKNSHSLDSVLSVDSCGNIRLVSQSSLQTISQNAFTKLGNAFGSQAILGTNDKNNLLFRTNSINRGRIDTLGNFIYDYPVTVNNSNLKVVEGYLEVNGAQNIPATAQRASRGINFQWGGESFPRGTISFNNNANSMNHTSKQMFKFYTGVSGVPVTTSVPDLTIENGIFRFGNSADTVEPTAAYQFKSYMLNGVPKGFLFPRVAATYLRNYITNPAEGLMIYNLQTHNLEIFKGKQSGGGWHRLLTVGVDSAASTAQRAASTSAGVSESSSTTVTEKSNDNSYVQLLGDGKSKAFSVNHNLNGQFVMVQFLDCGPEANCNLLLNIPEGVKVELDGKNKALITFKETPAFGRYKVMFLKVK